ncbi:MAG: hypothetical protein A2048_02295 [Deltaproteobacteria bacterium GWA2_45_12]|nr:MAG: hypothetical protein A2048_02295 [Deltaproteobacteria bacterium GWA2_45_12]
MTKELVLLCGTYTKALEDIPSVLAKEGLKTQNVLPHELVPQISQAQGDLVVLSFPKNELDAVFPLVEAIKQENDSLPIFVVSDNDQAGPAVSLIKKGVAEYISYPLDKSFKNLVQHALRYYNLTKKVFLLEDRLGIATSFEGMIGRSERMIENFRMIQAVAKSNATVLITGESGTGKELVAKAIHRRSDRASFRFIDLNCGAIPRDLLENELFGHERGAFTGAHKRYQGSFEAAHRGTLFLDEISEMDPLLQVKLLRVLQERSFMRIGGTEKIDVDVRIVAATNRNLHESIEKGLFREDLFYRLNVVNINIPSLRDRRADIPLLAHHFLELYSAKNNRIFLDFADDCMEALINYDWPGNVRELENTIERVVVLHNDSQVKLKFLSKQIQRVSRAISFKEVARSGMSLDDSKIIPLDDLERKAIEGALIKFQGNIGVAAKKLQIGQATLYRKVKKYGLIQLGKLAKEI